MIGVVDDHQLDYEISCVGDHAYLVEEEEKKIGILNDTFNVIHRLNEEVLKYSPHLDIMKDKKFDDLLNEELNRVKKRYNDRFQSSIEKLSQKVLHHLKYINNLRLKRIKLAKYLLITGESYYRAYFDTPGEDPTLRVLNPLFFYHSKDPDIDFINECPEAYYVERLSKIEILNRYGHLMTKEQRQDVAQAVGDLHWIENDYRHIGQYEEDLIEENEEFTADYNRYYQRKNIDNLYLNVYHVEWKTVNEVEIEDEDGKKQIRFREDLYCGIRIGGQGGIYLDMGKSNKVIRSVDNPFKCYLTFNGVSYNELNSKPYSMVLALADIQDKVDMCHYLRENIIARAHGGGVIIDIPNLPTIFGSDFAERLDKLMALVREGALILDSSQEGSNPGQQVVGNFPSNLDLNAIQGIEAILQRYDEIASEITGINRQMLGQLQERDGATVTKQALAQASLQTKEWFILIDKVVEKALEDLLNISRISYKDGHRGHYLLGKEKGIFTINAHYSLVDYKVTLIDGMKEFQTMQKLESIAQSLAQAGKIDIKTILNLFKAKTVVEAHAYIEDQFRGEQEELANTAKLQEEIQALQGQLEEMNKEIERYQKMEVETKLRREQREDRKLLNQALDKYEQRRLKEKELQMKEEAHKRRDELEEQQIALKGRTAEIRKEPI